MHVPQTSTADEKALDSVRLKEWYSSNYLSWWNRMLCMPVIRVPQYIRLNYSIYFPLHCDRLSMRVLKPGCWRSCRLTLRARKTPTGVCFCSARNIAQHWLVQMVALPPPIRVRIFVLLSNDLSLHLSWMRIKIYVCRCLWMRTWRLGLSIASMSFWHIHESDTTNWYSTSHP